MFDADMNLIGTPTPEQIHAAETADGGWIWLDPDGHPVNVQEHDEEAGTVTIDYGPIGNYGKGVGETRSAEGYRKVCVA